MGSLFVRQVGVICWVKKKVLLVSEDGKNWRIPVVNLAEDKSAPELAGEQAWQEGGVLGHASAKPLGEYLNSSGGKMFKVEVLQLEARKFRDSWPSKDKLRRTLVTAQEASEKVDAFGLRDILARLGRSG